MIKLLQPSIVSSAVIGFLFAILMTDKDYKSVYFYFFLFVFLISLPINFLFQLFLVYLKRKYGIFFYFCISATIGALAAITIKKLFFNLSLEIDLLDFYYLIFGFFAGIISSIIFFIFEIKNKPI
ncbi:MAG: hypothetical protein LBV56_02725 [Delftia acidovorans]|jgi:hypothetical protein|nr:hypothetical protein [Delftia acidovorans]